MSEWEGGVDQIKKGNFYPILAMTQDIFYFHQTCLYQHTKNTKYKKPHNFSRRLGNSTNTLKQTNLGKIKKKKTIRIEKTKTNQEKV